MLIFLKLGGSLITDKRQSESFRPDVVKRIAKEIAQARSAYPDLKLVLGTGAGSFGHIPAKRYGTRNGVRTRDEWYGFAKTADAASRLNRLVAGTLLDADVPVWTIQPGAIIRCCNGRIVSGSARIVSSALQRGLVPLLHGDVVLDDVRGGTIASTEEVFAWLIGELLNQLPEEPVWQLKRIVLAGEVDGIYSSDPLRVPNAKRFNQIAAAEVRALGIDLGSSNGIDVTGGMNTKVTQGLQLVEKHPSVSVIVCSGMVSGNIYEVLRPAADDTLSIGTRLFVEDS